MARGGNPLKNNLASVKSAPDWALLAVKAAEQRSKEEENAIAQEDIAEQKRLYGRVLQKPVIEEADILSARGLDQMAFQALETSQLDQVNTLYLAWAENYGLQGAEEPDFGLWLVAKNDAAKHNIPLLRYMLALQRTKQIAQTPNARNLEKKYLHLTGSDSLWQLLAMAEVKHKGLVDNGKIKLEMNCSSDRIYLKDLHDSYRLWVEDGKLVARHKLVERKSLSLKLQDGKLMDIMPGEIAAPSAITLPEGSTLYVPRAIDRFGPDTVVQLKSEMQ